MAEDNGSLFTRIKLPAGAIIAVFLLTLGVWIFFDLMDMPLQASSTTVVAAIMVALVMGVRWVWSRVRAKGGGK